jgi:hypothetical protein
MWLLDRIFLNSHHNFMLSVHIVAVGAVATALNLRLIHFGMPHPLFTMPTVGMPHPRLERHTHFSLFKGGLDYFHTLYTRGPVQEGGGGGGGVHG